MHFCNGTGGNHCCLGWLPMTIVTIRRIAPRTRHGLDMGSGIHAGFRAAARTRSGLGLSTMLSSARAIHGLSTMLSGVGPAGRWVPGVWAWRDTTSTHRSLSCALLGDVTCRPPVQTREEGGIQRVSAKAGLSNPLHPLFFPQDRAHARRAPAERRWSDVKDTAWEQGMRAGTGVLEDYDAFHCAQESSDSDNV